MAKVRVLRLEQAIKQEISSVIGNGLKDPRIGFVSITHVTVSGDLRYATVYVSILGTEEERKESLLALKRATGFLRTELSRRIRLRYVPELSFQLDKSIAKAIELTSFIDQLQEEARKSDRADIDGDDRNTEE